jgi:hypothetical protein
MQTHTVTTYSFGELSEKAQERAIEKERLHGLDYDWWDFVYEDAKTIGALMGIDIDNIYFSGFWSQGDGACFEGSYSYKKGALKAVKEHAPQDTDLHEIAEDLQRIQRRNFYQLTASVRHSGHYHHSGCTSVLVDRDSNNYQAMTDDADDDIKDNLRYFMDWIYKRLEDAHEGLTSDEYIRESLSESDAEYLETGAIYQ